MKARTLEHRINEYTMPRDASSCEKVLAISLDFDGNILHSKYVQLIKAGKTVEEVLSQTNQKLIDWLTNIIQESDYDRIVFLVGSNRQSYEMDKDNSGHNPSYSCFPVLETLFNIIKDKLSANDAKKMVFDRYLLADSFGNKPCGENFSHSVHGQKSYWYDDFKFDEYKINIIYAQTHRLAVIYHNATIDYYFVDDMHRILNMIHHFGKDEKLNIVSNKVSVNLFQHESSSFKPETDVIRYGSFQGILDTDPSYQQRIQHKLPFRSKFIADGLISLQQFFDDVNEKICALQHSDDNIFSNYLAHFRHHKTNQTKKFIERRHADNLNHDIQSLVTLYRKEFSEMARIITPLQSLFNEFNITINTLKAIKNSQPAILFIEAIDQFIVQTYKDIDLALKAKARGESETADITINNTLKSLTNLLSQLNNVTFEENNVKADLNAIKTFQQQYEFNAYLDYLYSMRYPLICGALSGLTAIFLALYPTTESSALSSNTRVTGLFFTCLSVIGNFTWGYNNAANSLLFHPRHRHTNNDLKAVIQKMEMHHLQK